jgi:5-amino-6-(5-phosphoribosylamino)uracil reductase
MLRLWPEPGADRLTDDELASLYAYPETLCSPYVRVNFVSSADGASNVAGRSVGLSSAPDRRVFGLLRELSEVVLVGAGTARAERYRGLRRRSRVTGVPPRLAVVTRTAALDPNGPLFTPTSVPTLVFTPKTAPERNRRALAKAGGEVIELESDPVSPLELLAALDGRGLRRVLCEGGPHLFADLVEADVLDELCLTIAPLLTIGSADRITRGVPVAPRRLRLASVLTDSDVLLLRYRRDPAGPGSGSGPGAG